MAQDVYDGLEEECPGFEHQAGLADHLHVRVAIVVSQAEGEDLVVFEGGRSHARSLFADLVVGLSLQEFLQGTGELDAIKGPWTVPCSKLGVWSRKCFDTAVGLCNRDLKPALNILANTLER